MMQAFEVLLKFGRIEEPKGQMYTFGPGQIKSRRIEGTLKLDAE
jgi:hypothetical protein